MPFVSFILPNWSLSGSYYLWVIILVNPITSMCTWPLSQFKCIYAEIVLGYSMMVFGFFISTSILVEHGNVTSLHSYLYFFHELFLNHFLIYSIISSILVSLTNGFLIHVIFVCYFQSPLICIFLLMMYRLWYISMNWNLTLPDTLKR